MLIAKPNSQTKKRFPIPAYIFFNHVINHNSKCDVRERIICTFICRSVNETIGIQNYLFSLNENIQWRDSTRDTYCNDWMRTNFLNNLPVCIFMGSINENHNKINLTFSAEQSRVTTAETFGVDICNINNTNINEIREYRINVADYFKIEEV